MKKLTKGDQTKEHLYRCALALFRDKGYDGVTVDAIVQRAHVAKGTFYIYFKSKSDIITELLKSYDSYYLALENQLQPSMGVEEKFDAIITGSCRFTQEEIGRECIQVLYKALLKGNDRLDALDLERALYGIFRALVVEGIAQGHYAKATDPDHFTRLLLQCIRGTYFEWCIQTKGFDLTEETLGLTRAFRKAYWVQPGPKED